MKYTRVFNDPQGESHFETVELAKEAKAGLGLVADLSTPRSVVIRNSAGINDLDWHRAPESLYIVMLDGKVQVEVSDGESRIFEAGDIMLMEDLEGNGHRSTSPDGNSRTTLLMYLGS